MCRKMVHINKMYLIMSQTCYPYHCIGGAYEFVVFHCTLEWIKMVEVEQARISVETYRWNGICTCVLRTQVGYHTPPMHKAAI